ncbi:MAG: sensor domain-containing diguanylate cyclase [Planctomycetota bacterium]|jgi:diguanylate cyclase (GGDEF)-like protein
MGETNHKMLGALQKKLGEDPSAGPILEWAETISETVTSLQRDVKKQRIDFSTIIEIANQINAKGLDLARIEGYTITMIRGQFGVMNVMILRQEAFDNPRVTITAPRGVDPPLSDFSVDGPFAHHLVQVNRPLISEEFRTFADAFPEYQKLSASGVEMLIPLVHATSEAGKALKGVLCLGRKIGDRPFGDEDRDLARVLGDMVAVALHSAQLYHRSIVDGLTQVYSRGHFDVHLVQEIARAKRFLQKEEKELKPDARTNRYVSLVMVDIDHFKDFNDTYGHQVGDAVLRAVAQTLHNCVRTMDIVARYGGEEFALVFPETKKDDARRIAERLRTAVENTVVDHEGRKSLNVTVSLGVATFPEDAKDIRDLVAQADQAMYRAKARGRNQVDSG